MGRGLLVGTLLFGAALISGPASASEIVAHAERPGGRDGTLGRPAGTDLTGKPKRQRLDNAKLGINDATGAADAAKVSKKSGSNASGGLEEVTADKKPAAEPPHLMLRGVRG